MKKQSFKKLSLDRETLVPLQPTELEAINGGTNWSAIGRSIVKVSQYACTITTTVASHPVITCKGQ